MGLYKDERDDTRDDSEVFADLWDSGVDVRPISAWKVFTLQKEGK